MVKRPPALLDYLRRRRKRRICLSLLVAVLLAGLMWADHHGWLLDHRGDLAKYDRQRFVVDRVVDGDTLIIRAPDGDSPTTRVRLWGINCPDLADPDRRKPEAEPWAEEARDLTRQRALGRAVYLELEPLRLRGTCGRLLAFVRLPDGSWLNERLLASGLAVVDVRWPHRRAERYERLQMQARIHHVGAWSE